jgi:hypothetical protein
MIGSEIPLDFISKNQGYLSGQVESYENHYK